MSSSAQTQPASTPEPSRRTGRDGSQNFSLQDKNALLDAVEQVKPAGPAKWDQVMDLYEEYCIENGRASRDVAALRRKFNQMLNLPKPTGDPTCPPDVRRAKELSRVINESLEMAGLSDDEILDLTEERVADAADDEQFETSSRNSSSGARSSDTPRTSSAASAIPGNSREQALPSRKRTKRDVTESLVSFLDVERREAREQRLMSLCSISLRSQTCDKRFGTPVRNVEPCVTRWTI
ncbi:hypothetical protein V1508DRAFT_399829 [Lipomyces doorenjongii]|uniref:uncharacterized protein n=1 Tax=Lipomyces doorenjongii TaxID=383834 RepID=UPI0034CF1E4C